MRTKEELAKEAEFRHRCLLKAQDDVKGYSAATRWRKCSEELPEKSGMYLCYANDNVYMCEYSSYNDNIWLRGDRTLKHKVTHWMPLPEPPKEDE